VVKVGRDNRYSTFSSVVPVLQKAVSELPAKLRTEAAQQLAQPRVVFLRSLLAAIEDEAGLLLL
jgi:uncharacterized protein